MSLQSGREDGSSAASTAFSKFVRLSLQSLALGLAALLAIDAKVSPGAVFAASFIVGRALAPVDQLVGGWKMVVQALGAYQTLRELFIRNSGGRPDDKASRAAGEARGRKPDRGRSRQSTHHRRRQLHVEAGEMIAIVGPSGAGKSTLVRSLAGALVRLGGIVRFDGADQRNWDSEDLAEHVGFMPQEPSLFAGTIKENIARFRDRLGEDPAEVDQAAVAAAKRAEAHEMILQLPGGYDYPLSLGGRGLSAGQAQRISLARALFRNPRYLILDEPNSNLDADGDQKLVQTLEELKTDGKTILIVAHRLSVLPIIDRLLVMQKGRLTIFGPRDEVLRQIAPNAPTPRIVTGGKKGS